uniref:Uncharacterized protein n=1 Tax=Anguilla anguilla TaxID=7936 RepID=A0A0E9W844_ANGAN
MPRYTQGISNPYSHSIIGLEQLIWSSYIH